MGEVLASWPAFISAEEEARIDLATQFSEIVDGSMRTSFELSFTGEDLMGEDGRSLDKITNDALLVAEEMARWNPDLSFELRRRQHERQEFLGLLEMARGDSPNTMVVVSDFPAELKDSPKDTGGYNVTRQQTMLRVLTRQADGTIRMDSQTLDESNREALEEIYADFGIVPQAGELLSQRISVDLDESQQANLTDRLMGIYDMSMSRQFGGEWHAGRQPVDRRNTYDFVLRQHDLLQLGCELQADGLLSIREMYNLAAEMQRRFEDEGRGILRIVPEYTDEYRDQLWGQINNAGDMARQAGRSFSGCGVTLEDLYGNVTCDFISKTCPMCKAQNVKTKRTGNLIEGACGCSKIVSE